MPKELFNQSQVDSLADSDRIAAGVPGQTGAKNILFSKFLIQLRSLIQAITPEQSAKIDSYPEFPEIPIGQVLSDNGTFINPGDTIEYKTASFEVIEGGTITGDNSDIQNANDGSTLRVDEAAGGLTVDFNFTDVNSFNIISAHLRYVGGASHTWQIEIYNYVTAIWNVITTEIGTQDYLTYFNIVVPQDTAYISEGAVKVRFAHLSPFIGIHYVLFDYVGVISSLSAVNSALTPEQALELAAATEHIDEVDEKKHGSEQIINAAALANLETAANAKVSEILSAINSKIASFVDLSSIDVSDIDVGEKKIVVAIKNSEGLAEFGGAIGLLDAIANPGVEGLLGETAAWIADEITLTGNNLQGQLGENSQIFPGVFDFYVARTHDNGTTTSNGSCTWRRYRSMDCLNILVAQHATIVGQLETESGWNAGAQFKQIAAKSKRGTWFRRTTGGYLFMCIDDSNGWTRVGTPPTITLEITSASHPNLTTSLNAHDFTTDRFYVEGTNATDEEAGQGQQYWNATTKNVFTRDMLGKWAKLN